MCRIAGFIPMPGVTRQSALEAVGRMTAGLQSRGRKEHGRVKAPSWAWARTVIGE